MVPEHWVHWGHSVHLAALEGPEVPGAPEPKGRSSSPIVSFRSSYLGDWFPLDKKWLPQQKKHWELIWGRVIK